MVFDRFRKEYEQIRDAHRKGEILYKLEENLYRFGTMEQYSDDAKKWYEEKEKIRERKGKMGLLEKFCFNRGYEKTAELIQSIISEEKGLKKPLSYEGSA